MKATIRTQLTRSTRKPEWLLSGLQSAMKYAHHRSCRSSDASNAGDEVVSEAAGVQVRSDAVNERLGVTGAQNQREFFAKGRSSSPLGQQPVHQDLREIWGVSPALAVVKSCILLDERNQAVDVDAPVVNEPEDLLPELNRTFRGLPQADVLVQAWMWITSMRRRRQDGVHHHVTSPPTRFSRSGRTTGGSSSSRFCRSGRAAGWQQ